MTDHARDETSRDTPRRAGSEDGFPAPPPPPSVDQVFGSRSDLAVDYVRFLADAGLERGLMGPRERPRLWDRHVLNSAAAAPHMGHGEKVVDIGSGAGLPGIPL